MTAYAQSMVKKIISGWDSMMRYYSKLCVDIIKILLSADFSYCFPILILSFFALIKINNLLSLYRFTEYFIISFLIYLIKLIFYFEIGIYIINQYRAISVPESAVNTSVSDNQKDQLNKTTSKSQANCVSLPTESSIENDSFNLGSSNSRYSISTSPGEIWTTLNTAENYSQSIELSSNFLKTRDTDISLINSFTTASSSETVDSKLDENILYNPKFKSSFSASDNQSYDFLTEFTMPSGTIFNECCLDTNYINNGDKFNYMQKYKFDPNFFCFQNNLNYLANDLHTKTEETSENVSFFDMASVKNYDIITNYIEENTTLKQNNNKNLEQLIYINGIHIIADEIQKIDFTNKNYTQNFNNIIPLIDKFNELLQNELDCREVKNTLMEHLENSFQFLHISVALRLFASIEDVDLILFNVKKIFQYYVKHMKNIDSIQKTINNCVGTIFLLECCDGNSLFYRLDIYQYFFKNFLPEFYKFNSSLPIENKPLTKDLLLILFNITRKYNKYFEDSTNWIYLNDFLSNFLEPLDSHAINCLLEAIKLYNLDPSPDTSFSKNLNKIYDTYQLRLIDRSPSSGDDEVSRISRLLSNSQAHNSSSPTQKFLHNFNDFNDEASTLWNYSLSDHVSPDSTVDTNMYESSNYSDLNIYMPNTSVKRKADYNIFNSDNNKPLYNKMHNIKKNLYDTLSVINSAKNSIVSITDEEVLAILSSIKKAINLNKNQIINDQLVISTLNKLYELFNNVRNPLHTDIFELLLEVEYVNVNLFKNEIEAAIETQNICNAFKYLHQFIFAAEKQNISMAELYTVALNDTMIMQCKELSTFYFKTLVKTSNFSSFFNDIVNLSCENKLYLDPLSLDNFFSMILVSQNDKYILSYTMNFLCSSDYENLYKKLTNYNEKDFQMSNYKITIELFVAMIETCFKLKDSRHIDYIMYHFRNEWHKFLILDLQIYNMIIKVLGVNGKINDCRWIFSYIQTKPELKLNEVTYGCYLDALINSHLVCEAVLLFKNLKCKELIKPNTIIYSTLVKGYAQEKQLNKALEVYNEMKELNISINGVTYNTLINVCARVGAMEKAVSLLNDMLASNVKPDLITYSTIAKGYCVQGDITNAMIIFGSVKACGIQPDGILYNSLLDGCVHAARPDLCREIWNEMQLSGIIPSNFTLTILIKMLGRVGNLEEAFELVRVLPKKYGFTINAHVYTCLMSACIANREYERSLEVYGYMKKENVMPDAKTYETILFGAVKSKKFYEALKILRKVFLLDEYKNRKKNTVNPSHIVGFSLNPKNIHSLWDALYKSGRKKVVSSTVSELFSIYGSYANKYIPSTERQILTR